MAGPLALHSLAELRWSPSSSGGEARARARALPCVSHFPSPHTLPIKLCPTSRLRQEQKADGKKTIILRK